MSSVINHCAWLQATQGHQVICNNHTQMIHGGLLPLSFCKAECPYRREPTFFTATNALLIAKQSSGEYTPRPRACGGCNTIKQRNDALQFVWPFWAAGANGDELRWSIRSVEHHYEAKAKITIVGDRPEWWQGHVIHVPRIKQVANWPFRDMLHKMWIIATHQEIDDEFVWMMDDIYLIKPCEFSDLHTPRAYYWSGQNKTSWQRRKANTMTALLHEGRSQHDYATHLPHYAEQAKLREIYERHDLHTNTMLWEVLYGNTYRQHPQHPHPFFVRINKAMDAETLQRQCKVGYVMNHAANAWNEPMRNYLKELFPEPAAGETEQQSYVPQFIRRGTTKIHRTVKRRPRHTHRRVIERQQNANPTSDDHSIGIH